VERSCLHHRRSGLGADRARLQEYTRSGRSSSVAGNMMRALTWMAVLACSGSTPGYGQGSESKGVKIKTLDTMGDDVFVYVDSEATNGEYPSRIKRESPQSHPIGAGPMTVRRFAGHGHRGRQLLGKTIQKGSRALKRWRFIATWVYKKGGRVLDSAPAVPLANSALSNPPQSSH
jgi:hypothetical protein